MKTNKHWKKIERAFDEWYDDPISDPDVIKKIIKSKFSQREEELRGEIETELHRIWASIPLTQGKRARNMIKDLIDKLQSLKRRKK